jgi:beta-1,4-mannosyl-glycoprotein beta-1,4-N-acetylglucosaminyltransferase
MAQDVTPGPEPFMVYDCFTFYNELDLLEIRLHTLADVVDRFVLVE